MTLLLWIAGVWGAASIAAMPVLARVLRAGPICHAPLGCPRNLGKPCPAGRMCVHRRDEPDATGDFRGGMPR